LELVFLKAVLQLNVDSAGRAPPVLLTLKLNRNTTMMCRDVEGGTGTTLKSQKAKNEV
jgi:hypothetical protein